MYKITDFGAARELQEDETFMSIYGTEEYLVGYQHLSFVFRLSHITQYVNYIQMLKNFKLNQIYNLEAEARDFRLINP